MRFLVTLSTEIYCTILLHAFKISRLIVRDSLQLNFLFT